MACTVKQLENSRRWREKNREKAIQACRKWRAANREVALAATRNWEQRNKERCKENNRKYRQAHPTKTSEWAKAWRRRNPDYSYKRYGCTKEYFDELVQRQGGVCAICKEKKYLCVDHCHTTGKVRGLLCKLCNSGIGHLQESFSTLIRAADYIRRNSGV